MLLLATQENEIWAAIEASPIPRHDINIDQSSGSPILRWKPAPTTFYFSIRNGGKGSGTSTNVCPGTNVYSEEWLAYQWIDLLLQVGQWLHNINREIKAQEGSEGQEPVPDWALAALPAEYANSLRQIEVLSESSRRLGRMAGLLHLSGDPLERLVKDAFNQIGMPATATKSGATYDLGVKVGDAKLLIEVTGIDGSIAKGSKKIAQMLDCLQREVADGDRVCVAVNAWRKTPILMRGGRELITPDALSLVTGLGGLVITTSNLFDAWLASRSDNAAVQARVAGLLTAKPGIVTF